MNLKGRDARVESLAITTIQSGVEDTSSIATADGLPHADFPVSLFGVKDATIDVYKP